MRVGVVQREQLNYISFLPCVEGLLTYLPIIKSLPCHTSVRFVELLLAFPCLIYHLGSLEGTSSPGQVCAKFEFNL